METWLKYLLIFLAGFVAGIINILAGAGSVLTIPALIFLGLPADIANGTNRIGIFFQNVLSVYKFMSKAREGIMIGLKLAGWTVIGSVAGSLLGIRIKSDTLQTIFGIIIIFFAVLTVFKSKLKIRNTRKQPWYIIAPIFILIGFYGGLFQAGVGLFLIAAISFCYVDDMVKVNSAKITTVLIFILPSLIIYAIGGKVELFPAMILTCGSMLGGYLGTHLALKKDSSFVNYAIVAAVVLSGLKLLKVF
ncbi:MAG: sulfite exporter TauE/SafE family protein [Candidatus Coatesbacteria bacterium]|nr:sulfite exporter TauE/SafE family protein [Candidatus Coatesbacteria bacterium]